MMAATDPLRITEAPRFKYGRAACTVRKTAVTFVRNILSNASKTCLTDRRRGKNPGISEDDIEPAQTDQWRARRALSQASGSVTSALTAATASLPSSDAALSSVL